MLRRLRRDSGKDEMNQAEKTEVAKKSIAELEKQLEEMRQKGLKNKAAKAEHRRIKSELNKLYADNKNKIMQFEEKNYGYLGLIRSTNNFYKMFEHSALFFVYNIAPKLNIAANLKTDGDYTAKSDVGAVSINNVDKLTKALATMKIEKVETKDKTGDFVLYKLPWSFTEKQLKKLVGDNELKMSKFNHVVLVDNCIPVLFVQLEELAKAMYENVRGMSGPVEREIYGYDMAKVTARMVRTYLELANGRVNKVRCLDKLEEDLTLVKYQVKVVADLRIWQPKTCARMGGIVIKLQEIIEREKRME